MVGAFPLRHDTLLERLIEKDDIHVFESDRLPELQKFVLFRDAREQQ